MVDPIAKEKVILNQVLRNSASNLIGSFIVLGLGFLLTPFILQQLGPVQYGLWVLVNSVVTYLTLLDLGMNGAVVKYVAHYRARGDYEALRGLTATASRLYLLLGLIAIALSGILALVFTSIFDIPSTQRSTATVLVLIVGANIALSIPSTLPLAILRGLHRFDIINLISSLGAISSMFVTIGILLLGGGVIGMAAMSIPVVILTQIVSLLVIARIAPQFRVGLSGARRSRIRNIISFGSPLFVMDVAGRLQTKSDEIVVGAFLPVVSVTPYYLSRRLSELPKLFTDQFLKLLLPLASELDALNDRSRLRALYLTSTRLTLVILLPFALILVILARSILTAWVGAPYADYAHLVIILTLASLVDTSQWPAGSLLQGMTRHLPLAVISLGSALANLALSIVLVRSIGLTGVALGTLIATSVECTIFVLPYALRVLDVSIKEALKEIFVPALLPAVPMALAIYGTSGLAGSSDLRSLSTSVGSGLVVYIVSYLLIGARQAERQTYRTFLSVTIQSIKTRLG